VSQQTAFSNVGDEGGGHRNIVLDARGGVHQPRGLRAMLDNDAIAKNYIDSARLK
jgi:hypothetical protein